MLYPMMTEPTVFFILAIVLLLLATCVLMPYLLLWATAAALAGFIAWLFPSLGMLWSSFLGLIAGGLFMLGLTRSRYNAHLTDLRPKQFIGETILLTRPLKNGRSNIQLHGATWYLQCDEDLPRTTPVRIINTSGAVLIVEKDTKTV